MADEKLFIDPKDALEHGYWGHSRQTDEDRAASTMAGQSGVGTADEPVAEKPAVKPRATKETAK